MESKYIPYGRQALDENDIEEVIKVLKSDYLTTGPKVEEFEKKIAEYVGAKYAVAVSNGTAALHVACLAAGIGEGDEVIVPPITFAATSNCVLYCGGTPVFADVDSDTLNIDPEKIRDKITKKTKAVIAVDFSGQVVDVSKIREICDENNLIFIEDAAHALGSKAHGMRTGSFADMTEFSFHPVKPITTGEGGVITTNDEKLYKKLKLFRSHGITRQLDELESYEGMWYYEQQCLGYNYRITDIQCALGISQLKKIDGFIERRREIADFYNKSFEGIEEVITPKEVEYSESGWHIYVVRFDMSKLRISRKEIFELLREKNIGVNVHYIPVYLHPYYKKMGYKKGICPIAERIYEEMITLPIHVRISDSELQYVVSEIKAIINDNKIV